MFWVLSDNIGIPSCFVKKPFLLTDTVWSKDANESVINCKFISMQNIRTSRVLKSYHNTGNGLHASIPSRLRFQNDFLKFIPHVIYNVLLPGKNCIQK